MAWKGFQQKLNTFKNFRANLVLEWKLFLKDCIELWNQEIDRGEFMPCPCSDWSLCSEGNSMLHLDQAPHPAKCRDSLALHPTSFTYGNYRLIFDFSSWHPLSLCSFLKFVCLVWVFWERIPGSSGWSLNCHSNENDCEFLIVWPPPELWDFRHKPPPHLALGSTSNTAPFSLSLSLCLFVVFWDRILLCSSVCHCVAQACLYCTDCPASAWNAGVKSTDDHSHAVSSFWAERWEDGKR